MLPNRFLTVARMQPWNLLSDLVKNNARFGIVMLVIELGGTFLSLDIGATAVARTLLPLCFLACVGVAVLAAAAVTLLLLMLVLAFAVGVRATGFGGGIGRFAAPGMGLEQGTTRDGQYTQRSLAITRWPSVASGGSRF
jgi:hypothetical protein